MFKKELVIITPFVKNELYASEKIKTIDNYELYFFPIKSYQFIVTGGENKAVIITRLVKPYYYTFREYFWTHRYYVDIIETYRTLITGLGKLHDKGFVYGGFGVLKEEAIRMDRIKKNVFLHNFQYTYVFNLDRDDMFVRLSDTKGRVPPHMWLLLYLKKNNRQIFCEKDKQVLIDSAPIGVTSNRIQELISISSVEEMTEVLKGYAFCWDVYELTVIYLELCDMICVKNKYFGVFIDILREIVSGVGVGFLTEDVVERLDHIVE
jgi:hypothetical protein